MSVGSAFGGLVSRVRRCDEPLRATILPASLGAMKIALATCLELPEPDFDQRLLSDALCARGAEASWQAWDDPEVDWAAFDLCVLRSTWDYPERPEAFASWLTETAERTRLENPSSLALWNMHKRYLLELEARGIPIVPTRLIERGRCSGLDATGAPQAWSEVVVKPAISAGSRLTMRVSDVNMAEGEAHFASLIAREDVLIQPYLESIEGDGERSAVIIDGEISHTIRKRPRFSQQDESIEGPIDLAPADRALAERVLSALEAPALLYGRVDLVTGPEGAPVVMELELLEPSLYLREHPPALEALVAAILERAQA